MEGRLRAGGFENAPGRMAGMVSYPQRARPHCPSGRQPVAFDTRRAVYRRDRPETVRYELIAVIRVPEHMRSDYRPDPYGPGIMAQSRRTADRSVAANLRAHPAPWLTGLPAGGISGHAAC